MRENRHDHMGLTTRLTDQNRYVVRLALSKTLIYKDEISI